MRTSRIVMTTLTLAALFAFSANAFAQSHGSPWAAIDDLGRKVATAGDAPESRENRTVGLFYFLWLDPTTVIPQDKKNRPENEPGPYDLQAIIDTVDPDPTQKDELLGSNGEMHFWGEPLFGYYDSRDPWVVRRHMQLIADAGVDVLIFDTTNAVTYPHVYLPLCDLLLQMKEEGAAVPQVTFMTNTRVDLCVNQLWKDFYSQEKYRPLFFQWENKPFLIADPKEVPKKYRNKFTFRTAYWPTLGNKNTHNAWQWVSAYPQTYSWNKDENTPEEVNVSTSQNLSRDAKADPVWMSMGTARGRSFVWGKDEQTADPDAGANFAQQWARAYELDPPFVMVTGWNEWIAGRWFVPYQNPETKEVKQIFAFVDQYNYEYSRDVEPNRSSKRVDAYYLQMADGIRKYKGVSAAPESAPVKTIDLNAGFEQWNGVKPELRDYVNETLPRDFDGVGGTHYRNDSGRNDIVAVKTARDAENVYVYIETREAISPELPNNLCVMFDSDADLATGWRGADLLIGREYRADGSVSVETYARPDDPEKTEWTSASKTFEARWTCEGNRAQLAVPLELFGNKDALNAISFKVLDNVPLRSPADLYYQGDVAPESAFFYRVEYAD